MNVAVCSYTSIRTPASGPLSSVSVALIEPPRTATSSVKLATGFGMADESVGELVLAVSPALPGLPGLPVCEVSPPRAPVWDFAGPSGRVLPESLHAAITLTAAASTTPANRAFTACIITPPRNERICIPSHGDTCARARASRGFRTITAGTGSEFRGLIAVVPRTQPRTGVHHAEPARTFALRHGAGRRGNPGRLSRARAVPGWRHNGSSPGARAGGRRHRARLQGRRYRFDGKGDLRRTRRAARQSRGARVLSARPLAGMHGRAQQVPRRVHDVVRRWRRRASGVGRLVGFARGLGQGRTLPVRDDRRSVRRSRPRIRLRGAEPQVFQSDRLCDRARR